LGCGVLTWASNCQSRGEPVMVDHTPKGSTFVASSPDEVNHTEKETLPILEKYNTTRARVSLSQMGSSDILKTQYLADKECGFIKLCVLTTSKNQPLLNAVLLGPV